MAKKGDQIVKLTILGILLVGGYPAYMFSDFYIDGVVAEVEKNPSAKGAAESLHAAAWRKSISGPKSRAEELYMKWMMIYGGDRLMAYVNDERYYEIEDFAGDNTHVFSPPRLNKETPHPLTAKVVYEWLRLLEERRDQMTAAKGLGYALDNLTLDEEMKKKYDKVKTRFMENGYYKPNR